jgi:hypothetical protein
MMITAPYMTSTYGKIRQEYLDEDCGGCEMYSFALGALDAPEVIAAGSHYRYNSDGYSFIMPSAVSRGFFKAAA